MTARWRPWDDECPECGDDAEVRTTAPDGAYDGDAVRCVACKHPGHVVVEESDCWTHWEDDDEANTP